MEAVTPKVHAHRRRRSESRHRQRHKETTHQADEVKEQSHHHERGERRRDREDADSVTIAIEEPQPTYSSTSINCEDIAPTDGDGGDAAVVVEVQSVGVGEMSRTTSAGTRSVTSTFSQSSSQQTVLLVNGEAPPMEVEADEAIANDPVTVVVIETDEVTELSVQNEAAPGHDTNPNSSTNKDEIQPNPGCSSSRNSSGDAQSLRETLQQLRPPKKGCASGSGGATSSSLGQHQQQQQQQRSHHHHHHHRERERDRQHRTRSPRETSASGSTNSAIGGGGGGAGGGGVNKSNSTDRVGILGFMEREMRQSSPTPSMARSVGAGSGRKLPSSLSDDPQASPAQRSIRSRSSLEKSPRRKRSKSESRRRRERKLIAAGEMEVRQANETLMRYLKQCSEMNDASLSGELEIDQSYDERRVHRKTKSQRDKRGHLISKLYTAGGGLSSLLKELSDDIVPAEGEEIYNPFTPVVSPTEDNAPAHIEKMFMQTSSGYRPVERCYYKHHHHIVNGGSGSGGGGGSGAAGSGGGGGGGGGGNEGGGLVYGSNGSGATNGGGISAFIGGSNVRGRHFLGIGGANASGSNASIGGGLRHNDSYGDDVHCLLETDECNRYEIRTNIQLACVIQRIWILIANICHGLLAGLALAHLLFVLSSPHPMEWAKVLIAQMNTLAGETTTTMTAMTTTTAPTATTTNPPGTLVAENDTEFLTPSMMITSATISHEIISDYASFAGLYLNTFYCLAIVCLVSVLDRMDICRWDLTNASELISFRWLIIAMIYIATIILTICSDTIDEKLYYNDNVNVTLTQRELFSNNVLSVWSSLSVTRSIGAICGWIMIGLAPHEDLLYEHLVDLTKCHLTN